MNYSYDTASPGPDTYCQWNTVSVGWRGK